MAEVREKKGHELQRAKILQISLVKKQIPPGVRRFTTKQVRYHKKTASCHSLGDMILARAEIDMLFVESLMASLLSKFIQVSANDCGYPGTRHKLRANWIHPLF